MPEFTPAHSISYPLPEDTLKSTTFEAKLASDIKATALSVETAITEEGERLISDANTKYGGLPARVTAVEQKNVAQDSALVQGLTAAAADTIMKADKAKGDAIADSTAKYGGLPARVTAVEQKNVAQDSALVQGLTAAAADTIMKADKAKAEAVTESKAYTDQVVDTSHLALDTDGTPYFSPGSMTYRIFMDTDGNPYFRES